MQDERQMLLEQFQAAFRRDHLALEKLLTPYTKNAVLTIASKTVTALLLATDDFRGPRPDQPMIAQLNELRSITLNGTRFDIWAHSPDFKNGGTTANDTITLTYWIVEFGGGLAFEFDASLLFEKGKYGQTVRLGNQLRWANFNGSSEG